MGVGVNVELPPMLTADVDFKAVDNEYNVYRHFVVLKFGHIEIGRWEWQSDKSVEMRTEPDEWDVADFIAAKLREKLFPEESTKED